VAVRPPSGVPGLSRRSRLLLIAGVVLLVVLFGGTRLVETYVNWLWFGEVGQRGVFTTVIVTRAVLFLVFTVLVAGAISGALLLAYRSRPVFVPVAGPDDPVARYRTTIMTRLRWFGLGIPLVVGVLSGLVAQASWTTVQLWMNGTSFGTTDPVFNLDVGFYAFDLPFYRLILDWLFVILVLAFLANLVTHYIFGGLRLAGRGGQLTRAARVQLATLAGVFVLVKAVAYWFDRYALLSSNRNTRFTGATYTDLNAVLPARLILLAIAIICAASFFAGVVLRDLRVPALGLALLVFSSVVVGAAWPAVLQQFSVNPNEAQREATSIQRNIDATRQAYNIGGDNVSYVSYSGTDTVAPSDVKTDPTISNVRLLDPNVVSPTFTQQQQLKNFYGFPNTLNVDRYTVKGEQRDYVVAARELDPANLSGNQTNWINRHTVYTHGDGIVAAPANQVNAAVGDASGGGGSGNAGSPVYTVSDLASPGDAATDPLAVVQPRIYYGPLIGGSNPDYAIVGGNGASREYDTDTATSTYDGSGGVPVGSLLHRLAFAGQYGERNLLFSSAVSGDSKILFKRDPATRVKAIAPWLTTDSETYPAVVDGRIQWIVDGYTTLNSFPYAQSTSLTTATTDSTETTGIQQLPTDQVSYIRNSVKATVDAYDGTVTLYASDESDPVLKAWEKVFPGVVKPASEVSPDLRAHFRVPQDLFKVQRELLTKYHVSDPTEFYNSNNFWDVATDPTIENKTGSLNQPPYYILAADPEDKTKTSFQLTSALVGLNRQFLSAYVTASSDPSTYGKITVLQLPTTVQSEGPQQVQNRMVSDGAVAGELNPIRQNSTTVTYGNLLTLPIGASGLLYVEPVYLRRSGQSSSFPQLARVIVSYNNKIGYASTLGAALDQVIGAGAGSGVTPPADGPTPGTTTAPPTSTTAPPTSSAPGGTVTQNQAVAGLNSALAQVKSAQTSGDLGRLGTALTQLDAAVQAYERATGQPVPTTALTAPPTPATPTPTATG
jgi:uncharacterized membrane protein (UPF0182 family)